MVFHGPVGARPTFGTPAGEGLADGETGAADGDGAWLGATLGARLGGADAAAAELGREDGVGEAAAGQPTATITVVVRKGSSQRRDPWCGPEAIIGFPLVGWARLVAVSEIRPVRRRTCSERDPVPLSPRGQQRDVTNATLTVVLPRSPSKRRSPRSVGQYRLGNRLRNRVAPRSSDVRASSVESSDRVVAIPKRWAAR